MAGTRGEGPCPSPYGPIDDRRYYAAANHNAVIENVDGTRLMDFATIRIQPPLTIEPDLFTAGIDVLESEILEVATGAVE